MRQSCEVSYCDKKHFCKGYCTKHYQRFKKFGTPFYEKPENFNRDTHKYCPMCKTVLEHSKFGKDKHRGDGLKSYCKKCMVKTVGRWQKKNPHKKKLYNKNYKKNNKIKINQINAKRRAITRNAKTYEISTKDYKKLTNSRCFLCGSNENSSIDHIIPLSKGGSHGIGNLQILCLHCNTSKQDRFMAEIRYRNEK